MPAAESTGSRRRTRHCGRVTRRMKSLMIQVLRPRACWRQSGPPKSILWNTNRWLARRLALRRNWAWMPRTSCEPSGGLSSARLRPDILCSQLLRWHTLAPMASVPPSPIARDSSRLCSRSYNGLTLPSSGVQPRAALAAPCSLKCISARSTPVQRSALSCLPRDLPCLRPRPVADSSSTRAYGAAQGKTYLRLQVRSCR